METYKQPQPTPAMTVTGHRNPMNVPIEQDGRRDWSNGLCDYFGVCGTCCLSCWCPCITYSRNKHRYDHLNTQGSPDPERGGGYCNPDCAIHGMLTFVGYSFVMQFMLRGNIRERYKIKGSPWRDCCAAMWCTPCELTQESRELELEEASYGTSSMNLET